MGKKKQKPEATKPDNTPEGWSSLKEWATEKGLTCAAKQLEKVSRPKMQERLITYLRTGKGKKVAAWLGRKRKRTQMIADILRVESGVLKVVGEK